MQRSTETRVTPSQRHAHSPHASAKLPRPREGGNHPLATNVPADPQLLPTFPGAAHTCREKPRPAPGASVSMLKPAHHLRALLWSWESDQQHAGLARVPSRALNQRWRNTLAAPPLAGMTVLQLRPVIADWIIFPLAASLHFLFYFLTPFLVFLEITFQISGRTRTWSQSV